MSFYRLPNPYNPGYAIPKYVMAEPPGRGTFTTKMIPRRTISQLPPDYLAKPASTLSGNTLVKSTLAGSSLGGSSLGNDTLGAGGSTLELAKANGGEDPIKTYGSRAANIVLSELQNVSPKERVSTMKEILDKVDPTLFARATKETEKFKAKGMPAKTAARKGLAKAFSEGITGEFVKLGKEEKKKGLERARQVAADKARLGAGKGKGALALAGGIPLSGITSTVKSALSKLGNAACDVATHPLTPLAAGAGAAAAGAPPQVGVAGATVAAGVCTTAGKGGAAPFFAPASSTPDWLIPAAIGGGALLLIVALK